VSEEIGLYHRCEMTKCCPKSVRRNIRLYHRCEMTKCCPISVWRNRLISRNFEGSFDNEAFLGQVRLTNERKQNCLPPLISRRNKINNADEFSSSASRSLKMKRVSGFGGELENFTSCVIADESVATSTTASDLKQCDHPLITTSVYSTKHTQFYPYTSS